MVKVEGSAGSYTSGTESLTISITLNDSVPTVIDAPAFTMQIVDCTPSYNWLSHTSPLDVKRMDGDYTVELIVANIPTLCSDSYSYELYFHSAFSASWLTQEPSTTGGTAFSFAMTDQLVPSTGTYQVPLAIRATTRHEIALSSSNFEIIVSPCALTSVAISQLPDTEYILGTTAQTQSLPTVTQTPNCGYSISSMTFTGFQDLLSFDQGTNEITIYGTTDPDGAISQPISATVTMSDSSSFTLTQTLVNVSVIDCMPDFTWLNQSSPATVHVMDPSSPFIVEIASVGTCFTLADYELFFPDGNPYPSFITPLTLPGGSSFSFRSDEPSMAV